MHSTAGVDEGELTVRAEAPRIRCDLEVISVASGHGPDEHFVRDPANGDGFRLGPVEWSIWRRADGSRSVDQIRSEVEAELQRELELEDLQSFLCQLGGHGLLSHSEGAEASGLRRPARQGLVSRVLSWPARILIRLLLVIPGDLISRVLEFRKSFAKPRLFVIAHPDRFLYWLYRRLRWVFTRSFVVVASVVVVVGLGTLIGRWNAFWSSNWLIWQVDGLLRLFLVGVFCVHVPHQFVHGLTCIHFQGRVRECGVRLILNCLPSFYCDVADARFMTEKSHRLWVIFSGLLYQLVALSVGVIGWTLAAPLSTASAFWVTLASTAFWGLVLNANPVIRRDMYFLLTGWLETPRLRERAREHLQSWVQWSIPAEALTPRRRVGFAGYALLSNLVGIAVVVLAAVFWYRMATAYHEAAGVGLMVFAVVLLQSHVVAAVDSVRQRLGVYVHKTLKVVLWVAAAAGALVVLLLPYPYEASGEVTLLPGQRSEVRSEVEGRVAEVLVEEGEWVEKNQPLVHLVDRIYDRNLNAAIAQLEGSRARLRLLMAGSSPEEIAKSIKEVETADAKYRWSKARAERFESLYKQGVISSQEAENARQVNAIDLKELEEKRAQLEVVRRGARQEAVDSLQAEIRSLEVVVEGYRKDVEQTVLVSPIEGRVVTPRVKEVQGSYIKPGQKELVIEIEDANVVRAEVLIQQEDIEGIELGNRVRVVVWSYPDTIFDGRVVAIAPVASEKTDAVLGEAPLTVGDTDNMVIRVTTEIENGDGLLKSEMTGYAKIEADTRPVWDVLFRPMIRFARVEVWSWIP